jgi:hypothetical protein
MPLVFTFDLKDYGPSDHAQIKSFFERFGWQNLGGSAYRYPKLGTTDQPVEDWFNHVIPALMLFRSYVLNTGHALESYTLDAHSSAGFDPSQANQAFGSPPLKSNDMILYEPITLQFGRKKLRDWLDGIAYPYSP